MLRAQPVRRGPTIRGIDTSAALALPGRACRLHRGRPQPATSRSSGTPRSGRTSPETPRPPLADDEVRFVGDPVALVVADSRYLAEDAAELVDVDYEPLPAVVDYTRRREDADALVHQAHGSNLDRRDGRAPGVGPRRRVRLRRPRRERDDLPAGLRAPSRWKVAAWSSTTPPSTGELTIYSATQSPHEVRLFCSRLLGIPEHRIRVVMRDTGGGFGQKIMVQRDEMCLMLAAPKVGAPLKWVEDRRENLLAAGQSRHEHADVQDGVRRRRRHPGRAASTSSPTAAPTRRRGRSAPPPRSARCFPAPTASRAPASRAKADLHQHRRPRRLPRSLAVRVARPRGAARHRRPADGHGPGGAPAAEPAPAATSCRTPTPTA